MRPGFCSHKKQKKGVGKVSLVGLNQGKFLKTDYLIRQETVLRKTTTKRDSSTHQAQERKYYVFIKAVV